MDMLCSAHTTAIGVPFAHESEDLALRGTLSCNPYRMCAHSACAEGMHLLQGAPCLKLLLLTEYSRLPPAMTERMQEKGIKVVKSPYKADASAVEGYLQEALRDSPKLLKYAKHILC